MALVEVEARRPHQGEPRTPKRTGRASRERASSDGKETESLAHRPHALRERSARARGPKAALNT